MFSIKVLRKYSFKRIQAADRAPLLVLFYGMLSIVGSKKRKRRFSPRFFSTSKIYGDIVLS